MRLTFGAILLSFVLLTTNLLLYTPFIFSAADAPVEVAAIIFTNHLLFAVIAVLAYQICLLIFEDRWKSLLGAFLCIACSSFVFWGSTAKEHMITATLFALVIYFFIRYLRRDSWWDAAGAFFCIGLLAWPRPEMGFTVAIGAGLFMIGYQAYRTTHGITDVKGAICAVFTAIFIFLGSIPLIVNNVITTGNPLVPLYILEETTTSHSRYAQVISPVTAVQNIPSVDPGIFSKIGDFAGIIGRHYVPSWNSLPSDIMGVFFYPETGHMGFTLVCPLAFIAVMLFLLTLSKRQRFPSRDKPILFFLFLMTLAVMITYLQSFQGMNTSHGITPDVRYLMPAYLTVGILGVYLLNFHGFPPSTGTTLSRLVKYSVVGVPLILVGIVALPPFGGRYDGYTLFFKMVITFLMVFFIAGFWFSSFRKEHIVLLTRCFLILIVFVLAWQMMMVFLYSVAKFNGYTFWIPLTDTIFHQVFGISITAP
ncbi:hypothetical protein [Methanoregula sp.]|uniref:hypothetical protein n=1 Tax=Methanoregula sp. TaxID=2052170 RepID=UPI002372784E|nr:hypothetical protein [Methanoregula sp.]MDD1687068.1 hypothetical protein [Methanoregula sp.]